MGKPGARGEVVPKALWCSFVDAEADTQHDTLCSGKHAEGAGTGVVKMAELASMDGATEEAQLLALPARRIYYTSILVY
jgi:hypothetical protein